MPCCPHCHKPLPESCTLKYRRKQLAKGLCWGNCGRPVVPGKTRCAICGEKDRIAARKRIAKHKAAQSAREKASAA